MWEREIMEIATFAVTTVQRYVAQITTIIFGEQSITIQDFSCSKVCKVVGYTRLYTQRCILKTIQVLNLLYCIESAKAQQFFPHYKTHLFVIHFYEG